MIKLIRRIRFWLAVFMAGLILSGSTAFPLQSEIRLLDAALHTSSLQSVASSAFELCAIDEFVIEHGVRRRHDKIKAA